MTKTIHYTPCWDCGCKEYTYNPQHIEDGVYKVTCTDCGRLIEGERSRQILMKEKQLPEEPEPDWDDCHDILSAMGVFYDLGCDSEAEQDDLTDQFYDMCRRSLQ